MGAGNVPWGEAFLAMLAMLIVLVFVLIYYCVMPVLTAMKRRKEQEEESWERDPRWNGDKFRYMPKLPDNFSTDKKYSRLAACSRSSRYVKSKHLRCKYVGEFDECVKIMIFQKRPIFMAFDYLITKATRR